MSVIIGDKKETCNGLDNGYIYNELQLFIVLI